MIELMMTIAIIGVSLAVAAPTIQAALANRRNQQAALDVVRLGRRARSEAMAYGRAYLLRFVQASANGAGSIELYRGINNGCNSNDWVAITGGPACGTSADSFCVDRVDMTDYAGTSDGVFMTVVGLNQVDVCYSPAGVMWWRNAANARFSDQNVPGANGFTFELTRKSSGTAVGVRRGVIFPFGGMPRIRR